MSSLIPHSHPPIQTPLVKCYQLVFKHSVGAVPSLCAEPFVFPLPSVVALYKPIPTYLAGEVVPRMQTHYSLSYFTSFSLAHGVPCLLHLGSCHLPLFLRSMCWHPSDSGTTSSSFKTSLATSVHTFLGIHVTYVLYVCLLTVLYILFDMQ